MTNREKALEELKRRIEEQKARVDPELLKRAAETAQSRMRGRDDRVPYDRKAAIKAVELFLRSHPDPKDIERLISEIVAKTRH